MPLQWDQSTHPENDRVVCMCVQFNSCVVSVLFCRGNIINVSYIIIDGLVSCSELGQGAVSVSSVVSIIIWWVWYLLFCRFVTMVVCIVVRLVLPCSVMVFGFVLIFVVYLVLLNMVCFLGIGVSFSSGCCVVCFFRYVGAVCLCQT